MNFEIRNTTRSFGQNSTQIMVECAKKEALKRVCVDCGKILDTYHAIKGRILFNTIKQ